MDALLVISQGIGLAAACGIRPFLPALLAGALAGGDRLVDFDRTPYAFLERPWFLVAVTLVLVVVTLAERRRGAPAVGAGTLAASLGGIAIGIGALEFAGSLADEGLPSWPGLIGGVACAVLAQAAARNFFVRVGRRLDGAARSALGIYLEGMSLALAAVALLVPPLSLAAVAALAVLLVRGRRRDSEKYAGLRVLR